MSDESTPDDELMAALEQRWQSGLTDLLEPTAAEVRDAFAGGCPQCLEIGGTWVHLRMCLTCGEVGCCDSSPQTHARLHSEKTGHSVIRTIESDEDWKFSYQLNGFLT